MDYYKCESDTVPLLRDETSGNWHSNEACEGISSGYDSDTSSVAVPLMTSTPITRRRSRPTVRSAPLKTSTPTARSHLLPKMSTPVAKHDVISRNHGIHGPLKTSTPLANRFDTDSDTDSDSDFESNDDACSVSSATSCSDSDLSDDDAEPDDVIKYSITDSLVEGLRDMLLMPHLCDTVFYVGTDRAALYGVKAIIATRSRVLYQLILQAMSQKDTKKSRKRSSKKDRTNSSDNRLHINIDSCSSDVFRKLLTFIHTGVIKITATDVIDIMYASVRYDVPELTAVCHSYIDRLTSASSLSAILDSARKYQDRKSGQKLIKKVIARLDQLKAWESSSSYDETNAKETSV